MIHDKKFHKTQVLIKLRHIIRLQLSKCAICTKSKLISKESIFTLYVIKFDMLLLLSLQVLKVLIFRHDHQDMINLFVMEIFIYNLQKNFYFKEIRI